MNKTKLFLSIFGKAQRKYSKSSKRLAGEGWGKSWKTLIATIYSAQSRDELTVPVMTHAFAELPSVRAWANAPVSKIEKLTKKINFYKTKSKNAKATAGKLMKDFHGKVPRTIEELTTLPGVGRKTANLIMTECHGKPGITVDTHVHRISNVLGLVKTKTPHETEIALMKIAPKRYWRKINRVFVLWGKNVRGREKRKLMEKINLS
jgi:endonuclease III